MGSLRLHWEPWEIDSFAGLQDYLIKNCKQICSTAQVNNALTGRRLGDETRYNFPDFADVILFKYDDGSGEAIVLGENPDRLPLRLNELKNALGYRELTARV